MKTMRELVAALVEAETGIKTKKRYAVRCVSPVESSTPKSQSGYPQMGYKRKLSKFSPGDYVSKSKGVAANRDSIKFWSSPPVWKDVVTQTLWGYQTMHDHFEIVEFETHYEGKMEETGKTIDFPNRPKDG